MSRALGGGICAGNIQSTLFLRVCRGSIDLTTEESLLKLACAFLVCLLCFKWSSTCYFWMDVLMIVFGCAFLSHLRLHLHTHTHIHSLAATHTRKHIVMTKCTHAHTVACTFIRTNHRPKVIDGNVGFLLVLPRSPTGTLPLFEESDLVLHGLSVKLIDRPLFLCVGYKELASQFCHWPPYVRCCRGFSEVENRTRLDRYWGV